MLDDTLKEDTDVELQAKLLVEHISKACDAAMSRRKQTAHRKPVYWWNSEIALLRSECHKARRLFQRCIGSDNVTRMREIFKEKRRALKKAIKASKTSCFKMLCKKVDENPWGEAYKIVMGRRGGGKGQAPTCPSLLRNVVETLFPKQSQEGGSISLEKAEPTDAAPVNVLEVLQAAERFGNSKAPGLDGIPNKVLKLTVKYKPKPFVELFTRCLRDGILRIAEHQRSSDARAANSELMT
uniref:Putative 115 kDa protein in type-1 retrotransposable element R1DM n=1 Tax=Bactrocera dorsalis TaxID=27457 RepID=A0A034VIB1_BACDO